MLIISWKHLYFSLILLLSQGLFAVPASADEAELKKIIALQQANIAALEKRVGPTVFFKPEIENLEFDGRWSGQWMGSYQKVNDVVHLKAVVVFDGNPKASGPLKIKLPRDFSYKLKPGNYIGGLARQSYNSTNWMTANFYIYIGVDQAITFGWAPTPQAFTGAHVGYADKLVHELMVNADLPIQ